MNKLNKHDIKKLLKEKPTEKEVLDKTFEIAEAGAPEYLDILLTKNPRIGRAVQLFLAGNHTRIEIAEIVCVSPITVGKWLRDPDIKKYMDEFQREEANLIRSRLQASSAAALEKMVNLLDSPIDGVALQAAKDLLDRAGHKPKQEIKKEVIVKSFEQELLEVMGTDIDCDIDCDYEDYEEVDDDETDDDKDKNDNNMEDDE